MSREWKVGDRVRDTVRMRDGVVVAARSDAIDVKLGNSVFTWVFPIRSLVHLEQNQSEEARVFPHTKVEVGGETVLDTTAKRSRTISPMVVRGYSICDPRDNSELQVTLCDETRYEASYILVHRENTDEVMTFDADLEEFELLLDVVKLLLQKEK